MNKLIATVGLCITAVGVIAALSTLSPDLLRIFIPVILIVIGSTVASSYRLVDRDLGFHLLICGSMTAILGGFWALAQYYPVHINTLTFLYLALIGLAVFLIGVRG